MRKKRLVIVSLSILLIVGFVTTLAKAAFTDKARVLGTTVSVGSSDVKLLKNVAQGPEDVNQTDELEGPLFANVVPNWQNDYLLKLYNNGTTDVQVVSNANYETANDPDELRSVLFVEPFLWDDTNLDGTVDPTELGASLGKKSITKWKTEGYDLGTISPSGTKGVLLRFSTENLSDTKQGTQGIFDFEFSAIGVN